MKLEVGMYVRTIKGIARIEEIIEDRTEIYFNCDTGLSISFIKKDFTQEEMAEHYKHSHNIIDLIEVGDYVNGSKLLSIDYAEDKFGNCDKLHYYYSFEDVDKDVNEYYEKLVIKSILTKEQFSQMEYKVV